MLFDTDILIWALRGSKKATSAIDAVDSRFILSVSYMEEFVLNTGLEMPDALIAATSAENCEILYTGKNKHYKLIPDIQLKIFRP